MIALLLILTACGDNDVLSEDFESDIKQVLPVVKEAHKKQEDYSEKESDLLVKFDEKYELGQFQKNDEDKYYKMNDVEKAIYHEIMSMYLYAVEMDYEDETAVLASEESNEVDEYKNAKKALEKLMKIDNTEDLPKKFKDKYPTYEIINGLYPNQFKKDVKELLTLYEPIINGIQTNVNNKEWLPLEDFLNKYKGDSISYPVDYKQNGKHYLINNRMQDAIKTFSDLKTGINTGHITQEITDDFNFITENISIY